MFEKVRIVVGNCRECQRDKAANFNESFMPELYRIMQIHKVTIDIVAHFTRARPNISRRRDMLVNYIAVILCPRGWALGLLPSFGFPPQFRFGG